MQEISDRTDWSYHRVTYWMGKYNILRRSRSEANYIKYNPNGDPFKVKKKLTLKETELKGLGLGLYWGEGTKSDKYSIRLGNSDPELIKRFMEFLIRIYDIRVDKLRFGLQVFDDTNPSQTLKFWCNYLKVKREQFFKVIITPSRGPGTYKKKIKYGVLTLHYANKKLRNIINEMLR